MSDGTKEAIELGWNVLCGLAGGIVTLIGVAFKAGGRNKELVTHEQLDKKLEPYARKDALEEVKKSVETLRKEQNDDFRTVINLLGGYKE